jgi:hypothetical protein
MNCEARGWIEPDLSKAEIKDLMQPLDEKLMKAEVIEKQFSRSCDFNCISAS